MEFQNGKIYTIRSHQTNRYYIGSTNHATLAQRLGKHRGNYKDYLNNNNGYMSSFEILQYTDHYIELLEIYPCNTKAELHRREGELIRQYRSDVVNIFIAGGKTVEQMSEYQKQYKLDHIIHIKVLNKQYNIDNKEKRRVYHKQNYINNNQKRLEYNKQTFICECGLTLTKCNKSQHLKSTRHINIVLITFFFYKLFIVLSILLLYLLNMFRIINSVLFL